MRTATRAVLAFSALALGACSGGGGVVAPAAAAQVVVAVDGESLLPDRGEAVRFGDRQRVGADRFGASYRLTTPADTPFAFDLVAWTEGTAGGAWLAIKHIADGGKEPVAGLTSIARVGIAPSANGMWERDGWLTVSGDGFARLTLQGRIEREQEFAILGEGGTSRLVLAIGERSAINQEDPLVPAHPAVISRETIYSSDSWNFGMPTIAVSGDRTSIVAYEGDRHLGMLPGRYEVRLQHDAATGAVTGGGSVETSADSGNWRDHEIAALYNVLSVARSESDRVRVKLSFDRGATFGQEVELGTTGLGRAGQTRLVQLAMAVDYSLAVVYWQVDPQRGELELKLSEGAAVSFDNNGSPTWFAFAPAKTLAVAPGTASPLVSGVAWSDGGDLVIGYGFSRWERPGIGWRSITEFHCAVRPFGSVFTFVEVDREELVGLDPSVAVLGQGAGLRIFYAYEVRAGVRLAVSEDAGVTFAIEPAFGGAGAHNPTVFARELGGATHVDVLYLARRPAGVELHHARWEAWGTGARRDHRLSAATMVPSPVSLGRPTTYGFSGPYDFGLRTTQVNWLGYDAVRDGDEIVVCYDEVTRDAAFLCLGLWRPGATTTGNGPVLWPTSVTPASPPPLAPGMTTPMPPVVAGHEHQLRLVRIN